MTLINLMRLLTKLTFTSALIFSLFSCSVQKRIYTSGYHVEKHNAKKNSGQNESTNNKSNALKTEKIELKKATGQNTEQEDIPEENQTLTASSENPTSFNLAKEDILSSLNEIPVFMNDYEIFDNDSTLTYPQVERKTSTLAFLAFAASIVGIIPGANAGIIVGFILGIISYNKIKKNPETLKGIGFSIAAMTIGALAFLLSIIIIILYLIGEI